MARWKKPDAAMSSETGEALERVTALAHRLAAGLAGEKLSANGLAETPQAAALAMGMFYFLLRIDPDDLHALFFAEGSMKGLAFRSVAPAARVPPVLVDFL